MITSKKFRSLKDTKDIQCAIWHNIDGKGNVLRVKGRAVDPSSKEPLDGFPVHQRTVQLRDIGSAEAFVCNKILLDWKARAHPKKPESVSSSSSFYSAALGSLDREEVIAELAHNLGYAESTIMKALTYLTNSVSKQLDLHAYDPDNVDWGAVFQALKQSAKGKSHSEPILAHSIGKQFHYAATVYDALCQLKPELTLPQLDFPDFQTSPTARTEQLRTLPMETRVIFAAALWTLAQDGEPLAFPAAMMLYGGLRTSEALAPLMGEFQFDESNSYAIYNVTHQVSEKKRTARLKTPNSRRTIVLQSEAARFILLRHQQMKDAGLSDSEISGWPIASHLNGAPAFPTMGAFEAFCKELLSRCLPASTRGNVSPYVLRRDYAGRAVDGCGLLPGAVDILLGHQPTEKNSRQIALDWNSADTHSVTAKKLDRMVFLPELSRHPSVKDIPVSACEAIHCIGSGRYRLVAVKNCVVTIRARTTEPGDTLSVQANRNLSMKSCFSIPESTESYATLRAAPKIYDAALYEEWTRQGESIAKNYKQKGTSAT